MADRTFTFLGTGTSVGVPMIGCDCEVCQSDNPRNHRYRCAVLIRTPQGNLLIDTPPELRLQLLRERVDVVHAVLFTHYHADHLLGMDDLRPVAAGLGRPVPLFCTGEVEEKIRTVFSYAFGASADNIPAGAIPKLTFTRIDRDPFMVLNQIIQPIPLIHASFNVLGFRIGDVAYCTDVNEIPYESWSLLEGVRVLVVDALRRRPHAAHFGLDQALDVIAQIRPERAYLTHMSHDLDYETVNSTLPPNVEMAYDGLSFKF